MDTITLIIELVWKFDILYIDSKKEDFP